MTLNSFTWKKKRKNERRWGDIARIFFCVCFTCAYANIDTPPHSIEASEIRFSVIHRNIFANEVWARGVESEREKETEIAGTSREEIIIKIALDGVFVLLSYFPFSLPRFLLRISFWSSFSIPPPLVDSILSEMKSLYLPFSLSLSSTLLS